MTTGELAEIIAGTLGAQLAAAPGAVLYSGSCTIAPGRFYMMGLNPGSSPGCCTTSIADALALGDGASAYTDQCWQSGCEDATCTHMEGDRVRPQFLVRHQRNVIRLAKELGHGTPATLPAANTIFVRSTRWATVFEETGHTKQQWWKACWPVHQCFLACIRPEVIVTLGYGMQTSAFGFLREISGMPQIRRLGDENRTGGWAFRCTLPLAASKLDLRVIGVPHPSWYALGERLADEVRKLADAN